MKADAKSDVAEYEKALAAARAEAAGRIDAARQTVDNERNAQLAQVNARIAAARAEAETRVSALFANEQLMLVPLAYAVRSSGVVSSISTPAPDSKLSTVASNYWRQFRHWRSRVNCHQR